MKQVFGFAVALLIVAATIAVAQVTSGDRARLERIQQTLSGAVPHMLCLDDDFATGGQPSADAYSKAAANGFRSVLSLRTNTEGIDLVLERARVESAKMRYFNIPVNSSSPQSGQADEFLRLTRDQANHPMLVNCASGIRVGAFMMILRVLDQGWSEDKALAEAIKIGLNNDRLKKFAKDYIATHKATQG